MVSQADYKAYQNKAAAEIKSLLERVECRPVLFIGCGLTRRYLNGPNWMDLLRAIAKVAGIDDDRFNFLAQRAKNDPADLGSELVDPIHEWAWKDGKNFFPKEYFEAETDKELFLKHLAAEHLKNLKAPRPNHPLRAEIDILKKTSPHAIISTNFDEMIEQLFPDFQLVIGEQVIPMSMTIVGEFYKIHGTVNDPRTLVLTREDYVRFTRKRRYISSKLMTYFAEYPVFIIGYGLGDSNVNGIIADLGEAMRDKGGSLDNVFYIEWVSDLAAVMHLKEEHVVPSDDPGVPPLRVRAIVANEFGWIFSTLADCAAPVKIDNKTLRNLAARVVNLVRVDVPRNNVELDYKKIENLSDNPSELATVLGISNVINPNVEYPYVLTQVAEKLGYKYWSHADQLLKRANEELGMNIKASDNKYHLAYKSGVRSITHKYSEETVRLLRDVKKRVAQEKRGTQEKK